MSNYRALSIFLGLLTFMLMFLIIPALTFGAEVSGGMSVVWATGHTHGGGDHINPGYGGIVTFEQGMIGGSMLYFNSNKNTHILTFHIRPKWKITESFDVYPLVGPTYDLERSHFGLIGGAGFDYYFTEDIGISPMAWGITESKRNYRGVACFVRYRF